MASAYERVDRALAGGEPDALRNGLNAIAQARLDLDDLERRTMDAARRAGLTWSDIAAPLRLGSRQAAEQRPLRLGSSGRNRTSQPPVIPEARSAPETSRPGHG